MPYHPESSITEQVHMSIKSSLDHLRSSEASNGDSNYLDSLVLHSPLPTMAETVEAWRTAESYVPDKIRNLGISNIDLDQLRQLYDVVQVKPAVVQNRFYSQSSFDVPLRKFCSEKSIIYQSFWILSANPEILSSEMVKAVASEVGLSGSAAMYCLTLSLGNITILNGTKNGQHMLNDLHSVEKARQWAFDNPDQWTRLVQRFKSMIGEN